ncbi:MAG: TrpR-like protein, YerC/YecD [Oscillospiraceae bacterium]|nr:TrpR-like protein, YerC/YecD [Oscillospiraceae bacterium]
MTKLRNPDTDQLFEGILKLRSVEECYRFFTDICTIKELQAMTQRLQVAKQLYEGRNYNEVYRDTGVSSATISRVNKCLNYGDGGYKTVLDRLEGKDNETTD